MLNHRYRRVHIKRPLCGITAEQIQILLHIADGRLGSRRGDVHARELLVAHACQPLKQGTAAGA